ncbi:hypothetical protein CBR_g3767 [Chara braunii]|uniref:Reverse transcriptase domain-containing protein n=1 Tax=Chara braunii TaxID=69332 RepID=A0A388KGA8_CHABU|nr:hypothetical protein CBR_g3767 [Chara braunii]|eukprot:GBG69069.1 hypothetical protein CBR_g3767 [Chara braunii]
MFKVKRDRAVLRGIITRTIKLRFRFNVRKRLVVRIKFEETLRMYEISKCCKMKIRRTCDSATVAEFVCRRIRVVWIAARSVGQIIHNHRRMTRIGVNDCQCNCTESDKPKNEAGHVMFHFSESESIPTPLKNSKNIPVPRRNSGRALMAQLNHAFEEFFGSTNGGFKRDELEGCHGPEHFTEGIANEAVMNINHDLPGFVVAPIDHNQGDTLVRCPQIYGEAMDSMFVRSQGFQVMRIEEKDVIARSKERYVKEGYNKVAKWNDRGELGKAFIIPEHKDATRWWPICPSFRESSGRMCKLIGKAVNHMLWTLPKNSNFNLKRTRELLETVSNTNTKMTTRGIKRGMIGGSFDIKDMFSKLPHNVILAAVEWVTEYYESNGKNHVRVKKNGKGVTFGKAVGKVGWQTISMRTIVRFIRYDLQHTFIVAAGKVLRQIVGIPMGKSSSPAIACLLCAHYECQFLASLGYDRRLIQGCRLVDDVSIFIVVHTDKNGSLVRATKIMRRFQQCYHKDLTLVRTDEAASK